MFVKKDDLQESVNRLVFVETFFSKTTFKIPNTNKY